MTKTRILLLDDNEDVLESLRDLFTSAGYEATTCFSLKGAIDRLRAKDYAFVLTNLRTEAEKQERVGALARAAAPAPVGVLSGWNAGAVAGAAFVMLKPVSPELLLASVAEFAAPEKPSERDEAIVRAYFAALENKDWDALVALCAPDVVYHLPGDHPKWSRNVRGRAAFRELARETFEQFRDARFEVTAVYALGTPSTIARYVGSWDAGGTRAELPGAVLFDIENGLITHIGVRLEVPSLDVADPATPG